MADWLAGVEPDDVVRIEIVRVTLAGTPSCVTHAEFLVHLVGGRQATSELSFAYGLMYESLVAEVRAANRTLGARRR